MSSQPDWLSEIIEGPTLELTQGELLLIDWCLCNASHMLPIENVDNLLAWTDVRLATWQCVDAIKCMKVNTAKLSLTLPEAKLLLAIAPTTFRWGTGPDEGYTFKQKLAEYIAKWQ